MLEDETIEVILGPGTMPGTEKTQELPVVSMEQPHELPPHLAHDPILTMDAPVQAHPSLFDQTFGHRPVFYPARPLKAPRIPVRPRDHLLHALAAGVIVMTVATAVLVESGFNSGLPQSEQQRLHPSPAFTVPDPSLSVRAPVDPVTSSPSHIPRYASPTGAVEPVHPDSGSLAAPESSSVSPQGAATPESPESPRPSWSPSQPPVQVTTPLSPSPTQTEPPQDPTGVPTAPTAPSGSTAPTGPPSASVTATPSPCRVLCVRDSTSPTP